MEREAGFYWVKCLDKWEVAQWLSLAKGWRILGCCEGDYFKDDSLDEIDENRIINPNE